MSNWKDIEKRLIEGIPLQANTEVSLETINKPIGWGYQLKFEWKLRRNINKTLQISEVDYL